MAKISAIQKDKRKRRSARNKQASRAELVAKRKALRARASSGEDVIEDAFALMLAWQNVPRDSSPTRLRNRCRVTGRPRGYYRRFGISRIALRELGSSGLVPGVRKSSW